MKSKQEPVPLGRHYSGGLRKMYEKTPGIGANNPVTGKNGGNQADEFRLFVAIVYGEANGCSEAAWRAVGHVIMNRVGNYEWLKMKTVTAVITQKYGFEAYNKKHFNIADKYLNNASKEQTTDKLIDRMVEVLKPVYNNTDPDNTYGSILYFSPKAQKALKRTRPYWADSNKLIEVKVDGLEGTDDFKFYKYKSKPKNRSKIKRKTPKNPRVKKS